MRRGALRFTGQAPRLRRHAAGAMLAGTERHAGVAPIPRRGAVGGGRQVLPSPALGRMAEGGSGVVRGAIGSSWSAGSQPRVRVAKAT